MTPVGTKQATRKVFIFVTRYLKFAKTIILDIYIASLDLELDEHSLGMRKKPHI